MVTDSDRRLDRLFAALADSSRRAILTRLAAGEATVGELAEPFEISRPAVSKHLNVLEAAGLIHRMPDGRVNRCRLDAEPLEAVLQWIERYREHWEDSLGRLVDYLEQEEAE